MKSSQVVWAILAGILLAGGALSAETQTPQLGDLSKVGSVSFPTSCDPKVQKEFERGVALLHSFFYEEARRVFTGVAEKDPQCASAYWGIAMTYYHPIWTPPNEGEMKAGLAAAEKALALAASEGASHERDFIDAIAAFYQSPAPPAGSAPGQSCHGPIPGDHRARSAAFEKAMERSLTLPSRPF